MPKILITLLMTFVIASCSMMGGQKSAKKNSEANLKDAAEINIKLAVGYIQRKQYNPARDKLEKAIDQDPDNVQAYKTLAYLYSLLGLNDKAEEKYSEALDRDPENSDLLNSYGTFLCTNGKLDEAQEKFKAAYSNPFYEALYLAESNAGSCYIKQGEYKKSEILLRKSLRVQPRLPGSLLSMADVGIKTERYLMARAYIQRYHAVTAPSPESLWLQIQAEKALGAKDHYMKYARQLIQDFPDSDEAGWVEAQARNEQIR